MNTPRNEGGKTIHTLRSEEYYRSLKEWPTKLCLQGTACTRVQPSLSKTACMILRHFHKFGILRAVRKGTNKWNRKMWFYFSLFAPKIIEISGLLNKDCSVQLPIPPLRHSDLIQKLIVQKTEATPSTMHSSLHSVGFCAKESVFPERPLELHLLSLWSVVTESTAKRTVLGEGWLNILIVLKEIIVSKKNVTNATILP